MESPAPHRKLHFFVLAVTTLIVWGGSEIVRQWIADGAKWGTDPIDPFRSSKVDRAGYDWWSLQPIAQPDLPWVDNTDWPQNEIDRFVLSKLEAAQLAPAEQANSWTLLRRLYFDLIGLPPVLKDEDGKWNCTLGKDFNVAGN